MVLKLELVWHGCGDGMGRDSGATSKDKDKRIGVAMAMV
jgi:hypothetical protein